MIGRITSPKYAGLFEYGSSFGSAYFLRRALYLPWEIPRLLDREVVERGLADLATVSMLDDTASRLTSGHFKICALEATWYMRNQLLRDTDWASMSHSVVVRVPLVDVQLWQSVATLQRLSVGVNKQAMANTPAKSLPVEVRSRAKTGFVVPTRQWALAEGAETTLRGLRGWAEYVLGTTNMARSENPAAVGA
jgi:asparagine synthase (glutamine-hydrolysing)